MLTRNRGWRGGSMAGYRASKTGPGSWKQTCTPLVKMAGDGYWRWFRGPQGGLMAGGLGLDLITVSSNRRPIRAATEVTKARVADEFPICIHHVALTERPIIFDARSRNCLRSQDRD